MDNDFMQRSGNISLLPPSIMQQICAIGETLAQFPFVRVFGIIGSVAKTLYQHRTSDVDLLVLVEHITEVDTCIKALKKNLSLIPQDDIWGGMVYGTPVSLAFRTFDRFVERIEGILHGTVTECVIRGWVVGGEIPEVILSDLQGAVWLFDRDGKLTDISRRLMVGFPNSMKTTMLPILHKQMRDKANLTLKLLESGRSFEGHLGFSETVVMLSRIYCIEQNTYHPGLKHILKGHNAFIATNRLEFLFGDICDQTLIQYCKRLCADNSQGGII